MRWWRHVKWLWKVWRSREEWWDSWGDLRRLQQDDMVRGDRAGFTGLNIAVAIGKYVNAKTSDDDIHMTITGYYIPA